MLTHIYTWWKSGEFWIHYRQRQALFFSPKVETDVGTHPPFYSEGTGNCKVVGAWSWSRTFIKCRREGGVELYLFLSLTTSITTLFPLTLRLLMSYIYIYIYICGAPSKARNANVVYIWTYVWQRSNSLFLFAAQCFNTESMQRDSLCHICV